MVRVANQPAIAKLISELTAGLVKNFRLEVVADAVEVIRDFMGIRLAACFGLSEY